MILLHLFRCQFLLLGALDTLNRVPLIDHPQPRYRRRRRRERQGHQQEETEGLRASPASAIAAPQITWGINRWERRSSCRRRH